MNDSQLHNHSAAIARAIALAEAALHECDEHGLLYPAIDISSALDKLKLLRAQADSQ